MSTPYTIELCPVAESVRTARDWIAELATQPIPSVITLRTLADRLSWIASQVQALELRLRELEGKEAR